MRKGACAGGGRKEAEALICPLLRFQEGSSFCCPPPPPPPPTGPAEIDPFSSACFCTRGESADSYFSEKKDTWSQEREPEKRKNGTGPEELREENEAAGIEGGGVSEAVHELNTGVVEY